MSYLLDTNVVSDLFRNVPAVCERMGLLLPADVAISSLTRMEVDYGLARNPAAQRRLASVWAAFLADCAELPFGPAEAQCAAGVRAALAAVGQPIGPYDSLIAATALVHGRVMVTANEGEFARVPELGCENWRA